VYARELFHPSRCVLTAATRHNAAEALGATSVVRETVKLHLDAASLGDHAVYMPRAAWSCDDISAFDALFEELGPWKQSPYRRSRHPAAVEEAQLRQSPMYARLTEAIPVRLFGMKVGYSIVNLYRDGGDDTDWHRDNFSAGGNRFEGGEACAHNATIGASFGAERELRFKHLESGAEFGFPQRNGDIFAFTDVVNTAFQHCIPPAKMPPGPTGRISVIWWGHAPALSDRIKEFAGELGLLVLHVSS